MLNPGELLKLKDNGIFLVHDEKAQDQIWSSEFGAFMYLEEVDTDNVRALGTKFNGDPCIVVIHKTRLT